MSSLRGSTTAATVLWCVAAAVALLAFLPWGNWLGAASAREAAQYSRELRLWALWAALVLPAAALVAVLAGRGVGGTLEAWRARFREIAPGAFVLPAAVLLLLATTLLTGFLFERNPHLVDTIAQLFQARIFAGGELTAPAPEHFEFFGASHLVRNEGRWFSQYPPGHPALLALGLVAGAPWLINPLFAAGTLVLLYLTARRLLGEGSARLTVALFMLSPFIVFMSASYMNHVTNAFFLTLALYGAVRAAGGEDRWAIWMGLALGAAATIRPLESAAWAGVLGLWLLARRGPAGAALAGGACALALTPLFVYNALTTGSPLRFGYVLLWGEGHGLGFHADPWGQAFTPLKSFANTALDFRRLNVRLFEWPIPSLVLPLAGLALTGLRVGRRDTTLLLAGLLLAAPVAYFFYWHRDDFLGPRFLYSSALPAILLGAVGVVELDERLGRFRPGFRLALLATALYGVALRFPERAGGIAGSELEMKHHPEAQARRQGIGDALAFVKVSWGSRLVARMWGWEVPASEAEQSYHYVDACRLQLALARADSLAAAGKDPAEVRAWLRGRLEGWRRAGLDLVDGLHADPSVLVDPSLAMPESCRREARRDSAGFTVYGTYVWRNDPDLREGIVFARDLGPELNPRLMREYPGRPYYLYTPMSLRDRGQPVFVAIDGEPSPGSTPPGGADPPLGDRNRR